jgi:hypothetical protein
MSNISENEYAGGYDQDLNEVDYNDLTPDEKAMADPIKKLYEKDKYVLYKQVPYNTGGYDVNKKGSFYTKKVVVYSTRHTPRSCIRNPLYGTFSADKVGTKDEYNYFKVRMANVATDDRDPITLFYDSPEGYEKHQYIKVSAAIKNAWHNRRLAHTGVYIPRFESPQFNDVR